MCRLHLWGASAARKYVLMSTNTQDSITINLEDKLYKDILDIQVPQTRSGK